MFYTIYKITNQINGKFYIGSHKTKDLDDDYMGSGKYLKHAQEKYGVENFTKEILFVFDNPEEMYAKEAEIVNEDFIAEQNTYNIKVGGFGGFDYINANPEKYLTEKRLSSLMSNEERSQRWQHKYRTDENFREQVNQRLEKNRQKQKELYPEGTFKGKTHSENSKRKMSASAKVTSKGERNSQYGTMWITDGSTNRKIGKNDPIPEGWNRGRTF